MNTGRIPGFTAEATLYAAGRTYRSTAGSATAGANALSPARAIAAEPDWIDCNEFPANNWCRECGNTGPDAAVCCPNDYCVVIDKTPFDPPKRNVWHDIFSRTPRFARR